MDKSALPHDWLLAAVVALATLTFFLAWPGRTYYSPLATILPKLYANNILVLLNSRIKIVGGRGTDTSIGAISSLRFARTAGANTDCEQPPVVSISREVFSDADLDGRFEMKAIGVGLFLNSVQRH